jgi:hypothetical protein
MEHFSARCETRDIPGEFMMPNQKSIKIKSVAAVLAISLALILLFGLLIAYERRLVPLVVLTVLVTSIWAATDSIRIELQTYKTPIALHPLVLFNLMYLLWVPLFPWYLFVRSKIASGSLPRKSTSRTR